MASIKLNATSGGGSVSIQAPSSSTNTRVLSLPDDADGIVAKTDNSGNFTVSGNLKAGTITDASGNHSSTTEQIFDGRCKAFVNFNGTGTVAIRSSLRVSSIGDIGAGKYNVNFSSNFADANYAAVATSGEDVYSTDVGSVRTLSQAVGSIRLDNENVDNGFEDVPRMHLACFSLGS
tara:strand:+ start:477 stop:1007 length:531 start_codon:yes stop_codon:yes gene_type:complete